MTSNVKFGRQYLLKVETQPRVAGSNRPEDSAFATIGLPISCEFNISRSILGSANVATFDIYNLAERSRNKLYMDQYQMLEYRAVQFWAGYSEKPPMIFNGNLTRAYSYRDSGSTNVITHLEANEGIYAITNGFSTQSLAAGQSYAEVLESLSGDLPFLDSPVIGTVTGSASRACVLQGNTWKLIQQYSSGLATIDNNKLIVLQPEECIVGDVTVINAQSGLLGSPKRSEACIEFEMVFTPQLKIGQQVRLESEVNSLFNGFYKIVGFEHSGMISESVASNCRTTVQLWLGPLALRTI